MYEFDEPENPTIISINSFSKLLGPGLRVGWIETHSSNIATLLRHGSLQSGGGFNPMTSTAILEMLRNGFVEKHIDVLRAKYKSTCSALCDAINEFVQPALREDEELIYNRPKGGFFCFVTLPDRFDTEELLQSAKSEFGVAYFAGRHFSPNKDSFQNCLRLCFAFLEPEQIRNGVRRLSNAIKAY